MSYDEHESVGGGGIVLPPTPEEYRRMWEQQAKQLKEVEYQRLAEANRQKAIKEAFQEQVRKAVEVKNPKLTEAFFDSVRKLEGR